MTPYCFCIKALRSLNYKGHLSYFFCVNDLAFDMEKVYRSCMTKNADGTNKIIGPGEQCLIPTNNPFWKQPQDIKNCGVKTRSCTKKEAMVSI